MAAAATPEKALERRRRVYQLHLEGSRVDQIARTLKVSQSTVHRDIQLIQGSIPPVEAETMRTTINERLSMLLSQLMPKIRAGDVTAINTARQIEADRARLYNLHTLRIDATVHEVSQQDLELQQLLREASARNTIEEARLRGEIGVPHGA